MARHLLNLAGQRGFLIRGESEKKRREKNTSKSNCCITFDMRRTTDKNVV
jgi:hypothetical protein